MYCRFPKYCIAHRNTIETYLVTFLDCKSYHNVIEAAKCAHALQQVLIKYCLSYFFSQPNQ